MLIPVGLNYRRRGKGRREGVEFSSDPPAKKIEISILRIKVKPTRQETQKQAHQQYILLEPPSHGAGEKDHDQRRHCEGVALVVLR